MGKLLTDLFFQILWTLEHPIKAVKLALVKLLLLLNGGRPLVQNRAMHPLIRLLGYGHYITETAELEAPVVTTKSRPGPRSKQMADVLNAFVETETQATLGDLFSYRSRTTKRLIRRVMDLSYEVCQNEIICNDALPAEVWFACVAPVMQGYWRSPVAEKKKKTVLDAFYHIVTHIIFNDAILPSKEFQELEPQAQYVFSEWARADLDKRLKERTNEYIDAMSAFFDRGKSGNPMPIELIKALTRNFFCETDSRIGNSKDGLAENPMQFTDATPECLMVAVAMIAAFTDSMGGYLST